MTTETKIEKVKIPNSTQLRNNEDPSFHTHVRVETKLPNGSVRIRYQLADFPESITDQDAAKDLTMKSIVAKLEKGIMPRTVESVYLMHPTTAVNYQDVHELQQQSLGFYNQLPTEIKKAMGNDYRNLESFVHDPKNQKILLQHGLLVENQESKNLVRFAEKITSELKKITTPDNPTNPPTKTPQN